MRALFACILLSFTIPLIAQTDPQWDDRNNKDWPPECRPVDIIATTDGQLQSAFFYRATGEEVRPLIVSLHTWSNSYDQKDTLAWMAITHNYNYIHPDFRGPNNRPEACGSELVIQDIEDAIAYARAQAPVDTGAIHVIGGSGGGYATLLTYMKSRHPIRTFSAWVPISNLVDWYYESVGRQQKYARDIAAVTNPGELEADSFELDSLEAWKRSPIFMDTPVERRQNSKLFIYTGIHDGYEGSVPITQSLRFFNKVVKDHDPSASSVLIRPETMLKLLERRNHDLDHTSEITKGRVHFSRQYDGKVQVNVFEGRHEILPERALLPLAGQRILAIGDSNGALEEGWVNQLRALRFQDWIYNTSVSGNTIAFDNLGRRSLNTLANAGRYLEMADSALGGLDKIVIMLGTNDCKAIFDDQLADVPDHLEQLITRIRRHPVSLRNQPDIYIVSPPPYAPDEALIPKYHGGAADIAWLFPRFREVAERLGCTFIDTYTDLSENWETLSEDGIHLKKAGQMMIARKVGDQWE